MKSAKLGTAEGIDFQTMTTEILKEKLQKVLEDPKYAENAKRVSAIFRDQKETPLERAVWWAEWLLRNPDSDYLKSPVLRLGFIVGSSFDVIAIISIFLFIALIAFVKVCVLIFSKLNSKEPITKESRLNETFKQTAKKSQ